MLKSAVPFKNQKYTSIRKDCLKRGVLFEDPEFLANNKSLFYSKVDKDILWKRPKELCKAPKLVVEGVSCDDLNQGELGNAWFVTACASIAQENRLWQKVVPNYKEQEWDDKNEYAGMFHFQFWRFGEWIDVVIDDRLPTKNGKLIFCHSHSRNEFWSALLEKAYAKLYGDYESLKTGRVGDALVDLTGGVAESLCFSDMALEAEEEKQPLFNKLIAAKEGNAMITCHIDCPMNVIGEETHNGLLQGQGYVMTDIRRITVPKSLQGAVGAATLQMVRLHNPWGLQKEWTGAWSPSSPEWSFMSPSERDKIGLKFHQEGEFWMPYNDFIANFSHTDICHFVNTSFFTIKKSWTEAVMHGEWLEGGRNGGSEGNESTFLSNPQYVFDVGTLTDTLMISLEQHDIRSDRQMDIELLPIGFTVLKIEDNRRYRVHIIGEKILTTEYRTSRSIFQYITLARGRYVLIPTTQEPGQNGKFLLRLYSGGQSAAKELTDECPHAKLCTKPYTFVSKINVVKAEGLQMTDTQTKKGTLDPFVIVRCEGEAVKSQPVDNSSNPIWQLQAIFYRKKPDSPILVEVWNHNAILDDYLAEARITEIDSDNESVISKSYKIYGRKKEQDIEKPGVLYIELKSNDDLTYL